MKDHLSRIKKSSEKTLMHKAVSDWNESRVKRDEGGQFASQAATGRLSKEELEELKFKIFAHPKFEAAYQKALNEGLAEIGVDRGDQQAINNISEADQTAMLKKMSDAVVPVMNELVREATETSEGYYEFGIGKDNSTTTKYIKHSDEGEYVAAEFVLEGDKLDFGIRGMKWGVRRSDAEIAASVQKRAAKGEDVTPTEKAKAALSTKSTGEESSADRYSRLTAIAKGGGAKNLSDADLKFYNARTEALAKINKVNETKPGWLKETTKTVMQNAAQRQMQSVANGIADKYISAPMLESLKKASDKK